MTDEQRSSQGEQGTTNRERSRLQQRLDEMSAAIEAMGRKAGEFQAESEARLRATLADLRVEQARLQQRLTEAQSRGTQAWRESRAEFDRRWTDVEARIAATASEWGAEREATMAKAGALLKTWQDTASTYADRMAGAFKGSREDMDRVLDDLRERQRELQTELNGLGKQSVGAWGAMAKGFEGAWRELEGAFRSAVDEFEGAKKGKSGGAGKAKAGSGAKKPAAKGGAKAKSPAAKPKTAKPKTAKTTAAKSKTAKSTAAKSTAGKAKTAKSGAKAKAAPTKAAAKSTAARSTAAASKAKSGAAKSTAAKSKSGAAKSKGTKKPAARKPAAKPRSKS